MFHDVFIGIESKEINETSTNTNNTKDCAIFIGLTVVFIVTSIIPTAIAVILSWKLYNYRQKNGTF